MLTELVYLHREGDEETISRMLSLFEKVDHKQLIEFYENTYSRGIIASHGQALNLLAMRIAFLRLFESSPILFEDNCIIKLTKPPIKLKKLPDGSKTPPLFKTDLEYLSRMLYELKKYGEIRSESVRMWWMNRY